MSAAPVSAFDGGEASSAAKLKDEALALDSKSPAVPLTSGERRRARGILGHGTAREVLARLTAGDPVGIEIRVRHLLRRRAYLLDPQQALDRSFAAIALAAPQWRGRPRLEHWLDERIEGEVQGLVQVGPYAEFHGLPFEVRDLFCRSLLDGEDPEALARLRCGDLSRFGRAMLIALDALLGNAPRFDRQGKAEPLDTGPLDTEPLDSGPLDVGPLNIRPVHAESWNAEVEQGREPREQDTWAS